jgi:hypothetical protein
LAVVVVLAKYTARHSATKVRLGADPVTAVKIPHVPPAKLAHPVCASVLRSSQCGRITSVYGAAGRHVLVNVDAAAVNDRVPFESTIADVYDVPYSETGNGSVIGVVPSSA